MPVTVKHTEDFDRIASLPRRVPSIEEARYWADALTPELRARGSSACLRPWQGYAIASVVENNGSVLFYPVGEGKTLLLYAIPRAIEAKRPIVIVPGSGLRDKTIADFKRFRGVWKVPSSVPTVHTTQALAVESNANFFERVRPDLILIDEADDLANRKSSLARRLDRYVVKAGDEVTVVPMTATPSRKSIMGYWHLVMWALRERAPMPLRESEALLWASALDERGTGRDSGRAAPGPLGRSVAEAREWFRRRLAETPGVVIVDRDSAGDVPLEIEMLLAREDARLDRAFREFLQAENEDLLVSDPLSRWRHDGHLGCGFYRRMVPPPPPEYRQARRELCAFVRTAIEESQYTSRPIDTEAQVIRRFPDAPEIDAWNGAKHLAADCKTEVVWVSDATIKTAKAWLAEAAEPSIVWTGSVDFAERLASETRLPYYGRDGRDAKGQRLHAAPPGKSFIASWHANKKGFNLQPWRRILLVLPPQSAKWLEQIFGRHHRSGADRTVRIYVLITSGGTLDAIESAIREARFARGTVSMTQKLLRTKIKRAKPQISKSNRFRWARKE